jgi:phosphate transport system substrate-binding protein
MRAALLPALLLCLGAIARAQSPDVDLRIAGAVSTRPLLDGIIHAMKQEKNLRVAAIADLTSADAIDALASGTAGMAIITRPLAMEDRDQYPQIRFGVVPIGAEAVALGVSDDIWDAGLHSISQDAVRAIYEQKVSNWKQFGGPDEKISFFNMAQGQGIWEIFSTWLYGDNRRAPYPKFEKATSSEDARDSLEFTPGSIAPLAAALVDGSRCHALGVETKAGIVKPVPAEIASGAYPMAEPVTVVVNGDPRLNVRAVTEFLTGPEGQALMRKSGMMGLDAVPKATPEPY